MPSPPWPISTVFRLYLENLNWVSNAQSASGPTPKQVPEVAEFLRGIQAMQVLQDRRQIVFGVEERSESLGGPLPAAGVTARDVIEAGDTPHIGYQRRAQLRTIALALAPSIFEGKGVRRYNDECASQH